MQQIVFHPFFIRVAIVLALMFFTRIVSCQNIVPNPSFEINTGCPSSPGQIFLATPWIQPTLGTSDYFHTCSSSSWVIIPNNIVGYQIPRTGLAYAGIAPYISGGGREYIQCKLMDSLLYGKKYCVTFYVNLANKSSFSISSIGLLLSDSAIIDTSTNKELSYTPQVINSKNNFLSDTLTWVAVADTITALGGEQYITIGNFNNDSNTDTLKIQNNSYDAYYYIDDVSIYPLFEMDAGRDTIICANDSVLIGIPPMNGIAYFWSPGFGLSDSTAAQPQASPLVTTTYVLTISDTSGKWCLYNTSDTVTVAVKYPPVVNAGPDLYFCEGEPVKLEAKGIEIETLLWSTMDTTKIIVALSPGTYWVNALNQCGAAGDTVSVLSKDLYSDVFIPNVFTPDGNSLNDDFYIITSGLIQEYSLMIFSRWGHLIYVSENINDSWNGKYDGKTVPEGIYFWIMKYKTECSDSVITKKGFVTLLR